jgi:hypothetical protein
MVETYGAHECKLFFVVESVYGETPANPSMQPVPAENLDAEIDPSLIKVRAVGVRDLLALKRGLRKPTLKISHILRSDTPLAFIQHVQTLNSLSLQALWYKGLFSSPTDVVSLLYKGCKIDKLTVECSIEDIIKATVELVGQDVVVLTDKIAGATYDDVLAEPVPYTASYIQRGTAIGGSFTDITRVTDWKFTVENNLKPVPVIRSTSGHLLKYLLVRQHELSGELTFEFENKTEFDDVINDEEFSLRFGLGGTSKATFRFCKWEKVAAPTRIEDLVSLKARFVARDFQLS